AVNVDAGEASETVRRFLPLAERLGRLASALVGGMGERLEVCVEGPLSSEDCRLLTLAALKGVVGPFVHEPVSFVNAPHMAAERGLEVRETKSPTSREYVNLVTVRGGRAGRSISVAGTLAGKAESPRIVLIDDHTVDVPPAAHMLVVRNRDTPGVIGLVGTILGEAGINIADMGVGRGPGDERALMVLATDSPVGPEILERLRAQPGIGDAQAIELG
ncbi:MAG: ACT domain-containing protein, partial [Acidimicrobiia bacterium]